MIQEICRTDLCTGCAACVNICSNSAISMQSDEKGFLRPVVSPEHCVDCGDCIRVCAQNDRKSPIQEGKIIAALAIDDEIRAKSSSGGVFSLLAEKTIQEGGLVFGAAIGENHKVQHMMVDSLDNLCLLQGSKYVQSEVADCYKKVKEHLEKGKKVLFSGTPCQADALVRVLGRNYNNLLIVDIVCHGVPSQKVLQKFISSRESALGKKAISVNFREKDPGWESFSTLIQYDDGTREIDNSYYYFFVQNYCLRDSCSQCLYSNVKRIGDLSLGDFWGYKESAPEHIENDDLGISLVSINSEKGEAALRSIKRKLDYAMRSREEAVKGNPVLLYPCAAHERSSEFWSDFQKMDWDELVDKYKISREKKRDKISPSDRTYYAKPYQQRHKLHLIHCAKNALKNKIRGLI